MVADCSNPNLKLFLESIGISFLTELGALFALNFFLFFAWVTFICLIYVYVFFFWGGDIFRSMIYIYDICLFSHWLVHYDWGIYWDCLGLCFSFFGREIPGDLHHDRADLWERPLGGVAHGESGRLPHVCVGCSLCFHCHGAFGLWVAPDFFALLSAILGFATVFLFFFLILPFVNPL